MSLERSLAEVLQSMRIWKVSPYDTTHDFFYRWSETPWGKWLAVQG